jgi:hypothetical protein
MRFDKGHAQLLRLYEVNDVFHQQIEMHGVDRRRLEVKVLVEPFRGLVFCVHKHSPNADNIRSAHGAAPEGPVGLAFSRQPD